MSCCGEKRAQLLKTNKARQVPKHKERTSSQNQPAGNTLVYFQYVGNKKLTVIGRKTRRLYRFDRPGAVLAVDFRDKRALEAVPSLRLVRSSTL
jgi:hypothetical protein